MGEFSGPCCGRQTPRGEAGVDDSLLEGDVAAEEPMMEAPSTREEPAAEHPTLGCKWSPDTQEEDRVEVHTPEDDPDDW